MLDDGRRYDPETDRWSMLPQTGAPSVREGHAGVWTGSELIIWGGASLLPLADGARYDPAAERWSPISGLDAPVRRARHSAVWTGTEMIVWGGRGGACADPTFDPRCESFDTGGRYDPSTDRWTVLPSAGAPLGRLGHTAIWTGSEMIVWGGHLLPRSFLLDSLGLSDGGIYVPYPGGRSATACRISELPWRDVPARRWANGTTRLRTPL